MNEVGVAVWRRGEVVENVAYLVEGSGVVCLMCSKHWVLHMVHGGSRA